MIEVIEQTDAAVEQQVRAFLAEVPAETGVGNEHDPRWLNVLHEALGHRPFILLARRSEGSLCGWLPLVLVSGPVFGRFLVSLPYLNRAGVVAPDADDASALIDEAVRLAEKLNVQYLELRHGRPFRHDRLPQQRGEKSLMVLDLPDDADRLWASFDPKVRNQVRKGEKHGLSIRWGGQELIDEFYRIFAINMRDLGTPVYPRKLFERILRYFGNEAELAVVDYQDRCVAAAMLVHDRGRTQVPSASSLRQYNATCANMWMYQRLLLRSVERGSREFDFGRSSEGSGTYRFKKQWGASPRPTVWQYHVRRGDVDAVRPDSPRYRRRISMWQKLPVWLTRLIGPPIVKGIP